VRRNVDAIHPLNDQRSESKMTRNILNLCVLMLLCDVLHALAASALKSDNLWINAQKEESSVVEYYKDHEVTEKQARDSLRSMKESDFAVPAHCKPNTCTNEHQRYCHSDYLLKDHCCCNQSHNKGKRTLLFRYTPFVLFRLLLVPLLRYCVCLCLLLLR